MNKIKIMTGDLKDCILSVTFDEFLEFTVIESVHHELIVGESFTTFDNRSAHILYERYRKV